jgi:hypothetical protein
MSPTLQNPDAQRNVALARSSERAIDVRSWPIADTASGYFPDIVCPQIMRERKIVLEW